MRTIDLIIFDCDGVLLDSEVISRECALSALRSIGVEMDAKTLLARFLGIPRHVMAHEVSSEGYSTGPNFVENLERSIMDAFETDLRAMPGMYQMLPQLSQRYCVASGSALQYIRRGLELAGLLSFFEPNLFSAEMVKRGKPAPDLFLHAAECMNVSPERCLVIEDSPAGIEAANAAGMSAFWFVGGSHLDLADRSPTFDNVRHDRRFDSMMALPSLIADFCEEPA